MLNTFDEYSDVRAFAKRFGKMQFKTPGHITKTKLFEQADHLAEEVSEFTIAADKQDLAAIADALVDLVYVAKGCALMMGLPWDRLWNEVQAANMRKVRGTTHRGHAVDVTKPEGWAPPDIECVLAEAGYLKSDWCAEGETDVDESMCRHEATE